MHYIMHPYDNTDQLEEISTCVYECVRENIILTLFQLFILIFNIQLSAYFWLINNPKVMMGTSQRVE